MTRDIRRPKPHTKRHPASFHAALRKQGTAVAARSLEDLNVAGLRHEHRRYRDGCCGDRRLRPTGPASGDFLDITAWRTFDMASHPKRFTMRRTVGYA